MALFDVDFALSCPYFVSDIQQALLRSTKNVDIVRFVSGKHIVNNFGIKLFSRKQVYFYLLL